MAVSRDPAKAGKWRQKDGNYIFLPSIFLPLAGGVSLTPFACPRTLPAAMPVPRPVRAVFCFDHARPQCSNQARESGANIPSAPRPQIPIQTDFFRLT